MPTGFEHAGDRHPAVVKAGDDQDAGWSRARAGVAISEGFCDLLIQFLINFLIEVLMQGVHRVALALFMLRCVVCCPCSLRQAWRRFANLAGEWSRPRRACGRSPTSG